MVSINILITLCILFAGNAAATVIDTASVACASGTTKANTTGPTRLCTFSMSTSENTSKPFYKQCGDASLVSFVSECKGAASMNVTDSGINYYPGFPNEECYGRQCNLLHQYFDCASAMLQQTSRPDYNAAAYFLLEQCSLRGFNMQPYVGGGSIALGVPATATILGAALLAVLL